MLTTKIQCQDKQIYPSLTKSHTSKHLKFFDLDIKQLYHSRYKISQLFTESEVEDKCQ